MDGLSVLLAIGLPWLFGIVWLRWFWRGVPEGGWAMLLGYAYVVGMLATTLLMRGLDAAGLSLAFGPVALALAGLVAAGAWLSKQTPWRECAKGDAGRHPQPGWKKAVFLVLLAVLCLRLSSLGLEAVTSPLFGWDAWATWVPKARVFYELRRVAAFVDWGEWLERKSAGAYTMSAAHYPPTLPLLQTWICLALGRWDDSLIGLPWLGCAAALGLSFYGQARLWGATPLESLTSVYLLLSLPLLDTQVAVPGNADLWMAAVYGLAAFSFCHWLRTQDARQGVLALVLALACVLIKVPGVLWMLSFVPALLVRRLSGRRLLGVSGALALALGAVLTVGLRVELPLLGVVALARDAIALPYLGRYPLAFHPEAWRALGESAFSLASWHLLWYVLGGIALTRWRLFLADRAFAAMAVLVVSALAFVGGVYTFSPLAAYALDYTQASRTALPMVPMLLFVALAAWRGVSRLPQAAAQARGT